MTTNPRQVVVISLLGTAAVAIAGSIFRGSLPSGRRMFAIGVVYVGLAATADVAPRVTAPLAGLVFVSTTLVEGVDAARAVGKVSTGKGPLVPAGRGETKDTGTVDAGEPLPNVPGASPVPAGEGGRPVSGGIGGDWAGSKPIAEALAAVSGLRVSSTKRSTVHTANGGVSDHYIGKTNAYATDLPVRGAAGDIAFKLIMTALGMPGAKPGQWHNVTRGGYRIQIGWKADSDHYDHIHIGVQKVS